MLILVCTDCSQSSKSGAHHEVQSNESIRPAGGVASHSSAMTDPSSTLPSGSGNAWSTNTPNNTAPVPSLDALRAGISTNNAGFVVGAGGAPAAAAAVSGSYGTSPSTSTSGPGTTAGTTTLTDDRLSPNATTLSYLRQCHAEVLSSLRSAQAETSTLKQRLAQINSRAQTEHTALEVARRKLEDALYVNAHLREENEMIRTDDERWAFQVEQREEQLESLTELLAKLERQQAEIDERKRAEEAEMVRRLEEERAEMVRLNMVAERERLMNGNGGGQGGGGGAGGGSAGGVGGVEGMPILPKGTGEMSTMLALAPEWTPMASSAGGGDGGMGGGGGVAGMGMAGGAGYHPTSARGGGGQQQATSLSEAIAIEPHVPAGVAGAGGGGGSTGMGIGINTSGAADDAASTVSALTTDM